MAADRLLSDVRGGARVALFKDYGAERRVCTLDPRGDGQVALRSPISFRERSAGQRTVAITDPWLPDLLAVLVELGYRVAASADEATARPRPEGRRAPEELRRALLALAPLEHWEIAYEAGGMESEVRYTRRPEGIARVESERGWDPRVVSRTEKVLALDDAVTKLAQDLALDHKYHWIGLTEGGL